MFLNERTLWFRKTCIVNSANTKKEREAINELVKSESSMEDDWTRKLIHQRIIQRDLTKEIRNEAD